MFRRAARALVVLLSSSALAGCPSDDGPSAGSTTTGADSTGSSDDTGTTGFVPSAGPLGCPTGETCTFVVVAQAFDDRVEIFAPGGSPVYRGAIDLDLKPNPMGDNSGDFLDEPFGMVLDDAGLNVLVGHYPTRDLGTAVIFGHDLLAAAEVGSTIARTTFFDGTAFTGVTAVDLAATEAIFGLAHPSGRQLIGVFANDLFSAETSWTNPGELLVFDPATGAVGRRSLASVGDAGGCAGAWSLVALDDDVDHVALGCDGDEGAVILDTSAVGSGTVEEAAAAIDGCVANVPFVDKRVRHLAPDGEGGIVLAENTPLATLEDGRLWRFDAACESMTAPGTIPGDLWEAREIVKLPTEGTAHWLMATGLTAGRGVHVVRDTDGVPEICATLDVLDPYWTATDGSDVHPYALELNRAGTHLAIGAGSPEPADDAAGYGRVLWVELPGGDPCAGAVGQVIDLVDSAPAVDAADPATWRRAPNVVLVREYG